MPQPGSSGMEPIFGEAYGTHRLPSNSAPFTISPIVVSTDSEQYSKGIVVMLGLPALSLTRGQPCELLSDLLEDGSTEDTYPSERRWDISALDDITRYSKGSPEGAPASCESTSVFFEGGREEPWLSPRPWGRQPRNATYLIPCVGFEAGHRPLPGRDPEVRSQEAGGREAEARRGLLLTGEDDRGSLSSTPELHSEEHNYSLQSEPDTEASQRTDNETEEEEEERLEGRIKAMKENEMKDKRKEETEAMEEEDVMEDEGRQAMKEEEEPMGREESCSSATKYGSQTDTRPRKRRCFWEWSEMSQGRDGGRDGRREGGGMTWSPSTLPSAMCLKEGTSSNGKRGQRKTRRTDASDLTPSPGKLRSLGEQLHSLSSALDNLRPVSDLPLTARQRSRKERNKLASRACRLKKKAQHEANKIKLWGLKQEYDGLLGAVLQIKELIRQWVESREEDRERGALRGRMEGILKASAGPHVAGQTKAFIERILESHPGEQSTRETQEEDGSSDHA